LIESKGFALDTVADASHLKGANGQTNWVHIRAHVDDAAIVQTLIHKVVVGPLVT
jgi:hypothetical protein